MGGGRSVFRLPCYFLLGHRGGIAATARLTRSLWGKSLGADPEHRSEKKLAVQEGKEEEHKGCLGSVKGSE